jgi:hypothetical protein
VFFSPQHVVLRNGKPLDALRVTERALAECGQSRVRDFLELDGTPVLGSNFESRFDAKARSWLVLYQRYPRLSARASDAVGLRAHTSPEVIASMRVMNTSTADGCSAPSLPAATALEKTSSKIGPRACQYVL